MNDYASLMHEYVRMQSQVKRLEHMIFNQVSLEDYFAARAMQALITRSDNIGTGSDAQYVANNAYWYANAMMDEREKKSKFE